MTVVDFMREGHVLLEYSSYTLLDNADLSQLQIKLAWRRRLVSPNSSRANMLYTSQLLNYNIAMY